MLGNNTVWMPLWGDLRCANCWAVSHAEMALHRSCPNDQDAVLSTTIIDEREKNLKVQVGGPSWRRSSNIDSKILAVWKLSSVRCSCKQR